MQLTPVTAVGLVVALAGFTLLDRARRSRGASAGPAAADRSTDLREHAWKWAVPLALLVVVAAEGNSLASIGWRVDSVGGFLRQVGTGVLVLSGLNLLTAPLWARVGDGGESLAAGIGSFASLSVPERLFVAFTAGATEETAFHGYALERLLALTGSVPLAGGVSFLAFTLGHVGDTWDRHAVVRIAQPALVTTLLYLWFRSLPALIAIHAVNDAIGLLLADRFRTDADGGESGADPAALEWLRGE
ncbi:CPBP family glutamic-type intramembrane protease [Halobellus rufus]|uniref:CPBP family glutamic-type intramembrane protease n=1 Tax=Halobellus rufus TaxID=1448860 RepID=UPI0006792E02|nr:CPBP family intramembrane glutamic endopeptidase [Halobellus rufus]